VAAFTLHSPVSGSNRINNKDTGGGDINWYSIPPLFRGLIVVGRSMQRPGHGQSKNNP